MAEQQSNRNETPYRRYTVGVVRRLDEIQALIDTLPERIAAIIAEQQAQQKDQQQCQ